MYSSYRVRKRIRTTPVTWPRDFRVRSVVRGAGSPKIKMTGRSVMYDDQRIPVVRYVRSLDNCRDGGTFVAVRYTGIADPENDSTSAYYLFGEHGAGDYGAVLARTNPPVVTNHRPERRSPRDRWLAESYSAPYTPSVSIRRPIERTANTRADHGHRSHLVRDRIFRPKKKK